MQFAFLSQACKYLSSQSALGVFTKHLSWYPHSHSAWVLWQGPLGLFLAPQHCPSPTHRATIAHHRPYTLTHVHACRQLAVTACVEVGTSTLVPPLPHHRNDRAGNHDCMRLCSSSTHLLGNIVAPSHFTPNRLLTRPASTGTMTTHHRITSIECSVPTVRILDLLESPHVPCPHSVGSSGRGHVACYLALWLCASPMSRYDDIKNSITTRSTTHGHRLRMTTTEDDHLITSVCHQFAITTSVSTYCARAHATHCTHSRMCATMCVVYINSSPSS